MGPPGSRSGWLFLWLGFIFAYELTASLGAWFDSNDNTYIVDNTNAITEDSKFEWIKVFSHDVQDNESLFLVNIWYFQFEK